MKATLLKMSVMTTAIIFLLAGASWADNGKTRHHRRVEKKHFRPEHNRKDGYRERSHDRHRSYEHNRHHYGKHYDRHRAAHRTERHALKHHRKNPRRFENQSYYRHKDHHKHYRKHRPSHNVYSYRASAYDPGFSITIKTKSRW